MSSKRFSDFPTMTLIVVVALTRLLPHWPNFTPVLAVALTGGIIFNGRRSMMVPLVAMVLSDIAMGLAFAPEYALHAAQPYVYGCIVLTALLGSRLQHMSDTKAIALGGLVSGVGFFLVTNFAVWLHGSMYPHTLQGLAACYAAGLAFYRDAGSFLLNGIVSTWVFSAIILAARRSIFSRWENPIKEMA